MATTTETRKFFCVAVETGSCSITANEDGEHQWEERTTCGHKHKTRAAAEACKEKLTKRDKSGNCSALWYNCCIHDQDGRRA